MQFGNFYDQHQLMELLKGHPQTVKVFRADAEYPKHYDVCTAKRLYQDGVIEIADGRLINPHMWDWLNHQ